MIRALTTGALVAVPALLDRSALRAQNADSATASQHAGPPPAVFSTGQPPIWRQQVSAQATAYTQDDRYGATFTYGIFRSFNKPPTTAFNPLIGLLGGTIEGYSSSHGSEDIGLRAMATSRLLATSIGADWDIRHD